MEFAYYYKLRYFYAVYDYVEKADLSTGYQNLKRKLGITMHFLEPFPENIENRKTLTKNRIFFYFAKISL